MTVMVKSKQKDWPHYALPPPTSQPCGQNAPCMCQQTTFIHFPNMFAVSRALPIIILARTGCPILSCFNLYSLSFPDPQKLQKLLRLDHPSTIRVSRNWQPLYFSYPPPCTMPKDHNGEHFEIKSTLDLMEDSEPIYGPRAQPPGLVWVGNPYGIVGQARPHARHQVHYQQSAWGLEHESKPVVLPLVTGAREDLTQCQAAPISPDYQMPVFGSMPPSPYVPSSQAFNNAMMSPVSPSPTSQTTTDHLSDHSALDSRVLPGSCAYQAFKDCGMRR